ncbi:MAG: YtxH domain-containing protein [Fodinibius sp.]|nr:YtxH domain-containing protein [Fodinibius sp.]
MSKNPLGKIVVTALAGAASGIVIGLLFAPEKGAKVRQKLSKKGDNYLRRIKNDLEAIRAQLEKRTRQTEDKIEEQIQQKGDELVEKAQQLTSYDGWTKDELYQRAKEQKISGYSTMNKKELIEALKNKIS